MLDMEPLHALGAVAILVAAAVPAYLSFKLQGRLRLLTIALAVFCVVHSFYHIAVFLGNDYLGNSVFEPMSVGLLLVFGSIFAADVAKRKRDKESQKKVSQS